MKMDFETVIQKHYPEKEQGDMRNFARNLARRIRDIRQEYIRLMHWATKKGVEIDQHDPRFDYGKAICSLLLSLAPIENHRRGRIMEAIQSKVGFSPDGIYFDATGVDSPKTHPLLAEFAVKPTDYLLLEKVLVVGGGQDDTQIKDSFYFSDGSLTALIKELLAKSDGRSSIHFNVDYAHRLSQLGRSEAIVSGISCIHDGFYLSELSLSGHEGNCVKEHQKLGVFSLHVHNRPRYDVDRSGSYCDYGIAWSEVEAILTSPRQGTIDIIEEIVKRVVVPAKFTREEMEHGSGGGTE